jgi:hypothetical protein
VGLDYTAKVIFGVPEPREWIRDRRTTSGKVRWCANHPGHQQETEFCPLCGAPTTFKDVPQVGNLHPYETYSAHDIEPGKDPFDDVCARDYVTLTNWSCGEGVYLGLVIASCDLTDAGKPFKVTDEQREWVKAYLKHLGYDKGGPGLHLVIEAR